MADAIRGSYMWAGDEVPWWRFYDDRFVTAQLAAEPAPDRVLARNERLRDFVAAPAALDAEPYAFFPPALAANTRAVIGGAQMTGGRTFLIDERSAEAVGLPPRVQLDLAALGWGSGLLEARLEVKGAGTLSDRTRLSPARLARLFEHNAPLGAAYDAWSGGGYPPQLMLSSGAFMRRPVGGQSERLARHAVDVSRAQLGTSRVKFVPVWLAVAQSPAVHANVEFVSRALDADEPRVRDALACELRFTPGTVRAAYFDKVDDDDGLVALSRRVTRDDAELDETLHAMIGDAARYLEVPAATTHAAGGGFAWIKIGDINELFDPDEDGGYGSAEEFRARRRGWFIAKDEVVVRRAGKFFTDMESYFGKDVGYVSASMADLARHHDLYTLAVLRDHLRVCMRFALAAALRRGPVSLGERRALATSVLVRIVAAICASPHVHAELTADACTVELAYARLNGLVGRFTLLREELGECLP